MLPLSTFLLLLVPFFGFIALYEQAGFLIGLQLSGPMLHKKEGYTLDVATFLLLVAPSTIFKPFSRELSGVAAGLRLLSKKKDPGCLLLPFTGLLLLFFSSGFLYDPPVAIVGALIFRFCNFA